MEEDDEERLRRAHQARSSREWDEEERARIAAEYGHPPEEMTEDQWDDYMARKSAENQEE
jgi:hypothetical protein